MKKSNIIIAAGCFIVLTAFLCINTDGDMYVKQKHFTTTSEIINELDNNPILARNERGGMEDTEAFKECISKRKRLTHSQFYFKEFDVKEVVELNEKQKQAIVDDYMKNRKKLSKSADVKDVQVERLIVDISHEYYNPGEEKEKMQIDLVFIDEGEGLVIDYIMQMTLEQTDDEKGDVNVEG